MARDKVSTNGEKNTMKTGGKFHLRKTELCDPHSTSFSIAWGKSVKPAEKFLKQKILNYLHVVADPRGRPVPPLGEALDWKGSLENIFSISAGSRRFVSCMRMKRSN